MAKSDIMRKKLRKNWGGSSQKKHPVFYILYNHSANICKPVEPRFIFTGKKYFLQQNGEIL